MISNRDVENRLIERFFLEPGREGPVRTFLVHDESVDELFQDQSKSGKEVLISALPSRPRLLQILAGTSAPPTHAGSPDYVRVLAFLSWMQTTDERQAGLREFTHMMASHLGYGATVRAGLPELWQHLIQWLRSTHQVDVVLASGGPKHIGTTLLMAFPTWRDKQVMRRARDRLKPEAHDDPHKVWRAVKRALNISSSSVEHHLEDWNSKVAVKSLDSEDMPFWIAWRKILRENGQYADLSLSVVDPLETKLEASAPEINDPLVKTLSSNDVRLAPYVRNQIRRGYIYMRAEGLGLYTSTIGTKTDFILARDDFPGLKQAGPSLKRQSVVAGWSLYEVKGNGEKRADYLQASVRWRERTRVEDGYLCCFPIVPAVEYRGRGVPRFFLDGRELPALDRGSRIYPKGARGSGILTVQAGTERRSTRVSDIVREHPRDTLKPYDAMSSTDVEGVFKDTHLALRGCSISSPPAQRPVPEEAMLTIGEALYARSARGLSVGEAFRIARTAIDLVDARISAWDVIRSYKDAGWFRDRISLRSSGRVLHVEPPGYVAVNGGTPGAVLITGATPSSVIERLTRVADITGCSLSMNEGITTWSPFTCMVFGTAEALRAFLQVGELASSNPHFKAPDLKDWSDGLVSRHRDTADAWTVTRDPEKDSLEKRERTDINQPPVFVSAISGLQDASFGNLDTAKFAHLARLGMLEPYRNGTLMALDKPGVYLPSDWVFQLRKLTGRSSGPEPNGGRKYAYPYHSGFMEALLFALGRTTSVNARAPKWFHNVAISPKMLRRRAIIGNVAVTGRQYRADYFGAAPKED